MKEKKHVWKRLLSTLLVCALVLSLCPTALAAGKAPTVAVPEGMVLISQANYPLTKGLTESQLILNDNSGNAQVMGYMATIEPDASVALKASYAGYYTEGSTAESRAETAKKLAWDMKTTTAQAADYEAATGNTVVAAVNGDYYNMQTGQCLGYLIMEGNVVQTGNGEPYFAALKDGTYAIRDAGTPHDDVVEAISGPFYLVKDGEVVRSAVEKDLSPRNSIGIKADGTVVIFIADGRQGLSNGMSVYDMARMLKEQGCVDALYLDGGGSATFASRHEGSTALEVQNHPSDGPERVVASSLMIVSTANRTNEFDHASLEPNNDMYFAGATVQFTAAGVDAGGYATGLPSNLKWALEDASFGTIDQTGLFESNGKCGTVTVNLMQGSKAVGTTSIEVQEPDELFFASESLNLAFNASSDLGLTARCQNRTMELGGYQFDWTITPVTEGKQPADIGSFDGNTFISAKAKETLNATISVAYTRTDGTKLTDTIAVEIGRMPQVIFDFEPDENGNVGKGVGQYDWGDKSVNPAGWTPDEVPITFEAWDGSPEEGGVGMKTESGPFFFDGTYLDGPTDVCYYPASNVFQAAGYDFFADHTVYMKDYAAGGAIVTAEDGEVRFGDYALRFDYDYTDLKDGYKNVNQWLYPTGEDVVLPGTPSGLGFWVYAPEGTANFWLWLQICYYDAATGTYKRPYIHLTTQEGRSIQYNGIYWDGWMYCEADLTPYAKFVSDEHPLTIVNGRSFISLTFIPGGSANENGDKMPMGDFTAGSLYFDNFRVVYGDTVDDMESPVVDEVKVGSTAVAADGSTVIDTDKLEITAVFHDPVSDNATDINTDKTAIYVDGLKQALTASDSATATATTTVPNGTHSITVTVYDGFGNMTTDTRYITVNAKNSAFGTAALTGADTATINEPYTLQLTVDGSDKISEVSAQIQMTDTFGKPVVTFENGYTGTDTYEKNTLTIQASSDAPKSGTVATITFQVDAAAAKGTIFSYTLQKGAFTDDGTVLTFAQAAKSVGVTAPYEISADGMLAGASGKIYVTTADGKAPGKVNIYAVKDGAEDEKIGTTNRSGILMTNRFCQTVGEAFTIYAKGSDGVSFRYSNVTNGIGNTDVTPTNVRLNAVTSPSTTQSVTWFAAPEYTLQKAVVEYTTASAYDSGTYTFQTAAGTSERQTFVSDKRVSLVNTATLDNLKPGTTYCYRVGDGVDGHWSEVQRFTTAVDDAETSFFVMGDTQLNGSVASDTEAIETLHKIGQSIAEENVDFGLQTGDFIDTASSLEAWDEILGVFGEDYPTTPIIQVLGNHEYYGDTSGNLASTIFDVPSKDCYSVEYGNVYIAVINCSTDLNQAAAWLVQDAQASDCQWKVLALHQPPYYTNPKGSSEPYNKIIPAAAEEAGIDFVFSGHDHAYARTEPIANGAVDEDGVVYFICGDLGEKSRSTEYAAVNNPDFHFAKINQQYDAIYLIVNATDEAMTVTAYNLDGSVVDTYTKDYVTDCDREGHDYVFDRETGTLTCTKCGDVSTNYTGWAIDKATGTSMYFLNGAYKTGWFTIAAEIYHFGSDGLQHQVTVIEDVPTDCATVGHKTVQCACGETQTNTYEAPAGHIYEEKTAEDGTTYYECVNCHKISSINVPFVDIADKGWYLPAVEFTYRTELISGVTNITFCPQDEMTRAMLVAILWRLDGKEAVSSTSQQFTDVRSGRWYTQPINWAAAHGIVAGVTDTTFEPDRAITRQEVAAILYRYAVYKNYDVSESNDLSAFTDADLVQNYAVTSMQWAVGSCLISGMSTTTLSPRTTATRAQVAMIVMEFANRYVPDLQ